MLSIIETIITLILLLSGTYETGYTSRYDPGIMAHVADYHGIDLSQVDGGVAVADCSNIGERWLIRPFGSDKWFVVYVVDCAGNDGTAHWMEMNNIIVELSYPLAVAFNGVDGGVKVEVIRP